MTRNRTITPADHANTVREHERFMWGNATTEKKRESSKEFDVALYALTERAEQARAALQRLADEPMLSRGEVSRIALAALAEGEGPR